MIEKDPDQRQWLFEEQQELERVQRRLASAHRMRWRIAFALAIAAAITLIAFVIWQLTRGPFD